MHGIKNIIVPIIASVVGVMGVVAGPAHAGGDPEFGCTVSQNIITQTVELDPRYEGTLMEGGVGKRSADAVRRYMTDKVRPLVQVDGRSDVGGQGGASASSGSGGGGR